MDAQKVTAPQELDRSRPRTLARIVHQTAQPLTTLGCILELSLHESLTIEEHKTRTRQAIDQLRRVTATFDELREFAENMDRFGTEWGGALSNV
jgi:hypothetical protein